MTLCHISPCDHPPITPVLIITHLDSHYEELDIPHTVKACTKDDQINQICEFLQYCVYLPNLSDSDYTSFMNTATHFFFLNGSLYCQEKYGWHQLVVPVEYCYRLIREAYDSLGHKSVFSVWTHLLHVGQWHQMVHLDLPWISNLPNYQATHPSYHSSHG